MKIKILPLVTLTALVSLSAQAQSVMTLDDCIGRAIEANFGLEGSRLRTQQAGNNVTIAPFTPTLSANAKQNQTTMNGGMTNTLGVGLSLNWRLFDGLAMFTTHERSRQELSAEQLRLRNNFETLTSGVTNKYYLLVSLRNRADVARESMALSQLRYREAMAKYRIGAASGLEMKLAKTDLNADSSNLIKQQEALNLAYIEMNQMLNMPLEMTAYVSDSIRMVGELNRDTLRITTLANNSEILLSRVGIRLSELDLKLARAARYPTLDFAAGYNYNATDANNFAGTFKNSNGPNWGFNVGVNIFDGLEAGRKIKNARLERDISQVSQGEVSLSVMSDLEKLYVNYINNLQLIDFESQNSDAARLNLEVAMERYRLGDLSGIDFRNIQQQYLSAVDRKINVVYQAKASEVALLTLAGRILEL